MAEQTFLEETEDSSNVDDSSVSSTSEVEKEKNEDSDENPKDLGEKKESKIFLCHYRTIDISKDLERYNFPEKIKEKAAQLARDLRLESRKSRPKLELLFFCVKSAYAECGKLYDSNAIAEELDNMTKKEVNHSNSTYTQVQTGYSEPEVKQNVTNYVNMYLDKLGIESENVGPEVMKRITPLIKNDRKQPRETQKLKKLPQDLAVAGIIYYLMMKGFKVNIEKIVNTVKRPSIDIILKIKDNYERIENM